jgi:hypothetical protein
MTSPEPVRLWRPIDLAAVVIGNATGLVVILAAWTGAGHEVVTDRQIGWVNLGIAGLVIITVANTGWLLAGRRACWRLRHGLLPAERGLPWPGQPRAVAAPSAALARFVASEAMTWFHAPDCRMVAGKDLISGSEAEHSAVGRRPCAICLPEGKTDRP